MAAAAARLEGREAPLLGLAGVPLDRPLEPRVGDGGVSNVPSAQGRDVVLDREEGSIGSRTQAAAAAAGGRR